MDCTASGFSTQTLLLWIHDVVIAAVCGFVLFCWNTRRLEGSICCSKTFIYLSAFIVPSKTCKLPIPYALMPPIPLEMLAFELNADNTLEGPIDNGHPTKVSGLVPYAQRFLQCLWIFWWYYAMMRFAKPLIFWLGIWIWFKNIVFKVFHNLFAHSFTDWRASALLYFWETLPL